MDACAGSRRKAFEDDGGDRIKEPWPGPARHARAHPRKHEGFAQPNSVVAFNLAFLLVIRVPKRLAKKQRPLASCDEGVRGPSLARPRLEKS